MIVTIDGPAGAGKSSVTRLLAQRLGFSFLDTGAMYRAVTWAALQRQVDLEKEAELLQIACAIAIEFDGEIVLVDGADVSEQLRTPEVTRQIANIADAPTVRAHLVELQRAIACHGNFVCEGRDQGTVVFPNAECKIFLTASDQQRAERRLLQLKNQGREINLETILQEQTRRDQQDLSRPVGRLRKAEDAIEYNTDHQTLEEVVQALLTLVREKLDRATA